MAESETIYALSTPRGRSAIAVIRLTGPRASAVLRALSGDVPPVRHARLATLRDPKTKDSLDKAVILYFAGPKSFTGEDMAEVHCHGGSAVIAAILGVLAAEPGVRVAEAGEFTRRAFDAGRLDLTEVEGLADLLEAETEAQRRQAFRQMEGGLADRVESWRTRLIRIMAMAEAEMDFPDEDLPPDLLEGAKQDIQQLQEEILATLQEGDRGERIRGGYQVALIGPPNAGKSTLLNAMARRDIAIVSEEAGTTRDILEVHLDLGGWPVTVADMAGLREPQGRVEEMGLARARGRAETADLRIVLLPPDMTLEAAGFAESLAFLRAGDLFVRSKSDLRQGEGGRDLEVSAITGVGIATLLRMIESRAAAALAVTEAPGLTRARHRECVADTYDALSRALEKWIVGPELRAEELRLAARALGRLAGRVDVEEILDVVFGTFCIGK